MSRNGFKPSNLRKPKVSSNLVSCFVIGFLRTSLIAKLKFSASLFPWLGFVEKPNLSIWIGDGASVIGSVDWAAKLLLTRDRDWETEKLKI